MLTPASKSPMPNFAAPVTRHRPVAGNPGAAKPWIVRLLLPKEIAPMAKSAPVFMTVESATPSVYVQPAEGVAPIVTASGSLRTVSCAVPVSRPTPVAATTV